MHAARGREKLLARVRRLRGQAEGIERAIEGGETCGLDMHKIAGARGAMAGLKSEVVEDHVSSHLVDQEKHPSALDRDAAEEQLEVIRT